MVAAPRDAQQRKRDTLARLENDVDAWVATASGTGTPCLIPLSFHWDGSRLLLATTATSPTARNVRENGNIQVALGTTRDVVLIAGTAELVALDELAKELGDAFATRAGFEPRRPGSPHVYIRVSPRRIRAWREENELAGRELMRDGAWIVPD